MSRRTAFALILASLAFGFVLGWVLAGGRKNLDRPTPGELSQQMAPGMNQTQNQGTLSQGNTQSAQMSQNVEAMPEWQQALRENQQRIEKNPEDGEAWRNLGKLYAVADQTDKAVEAYQRALELNPGDLQAKVELGFVYLNRGDLVTADKLADEVLEQNPDQPDALFLKGTTDAMYHRNRQAAIEKYERLLEVEPNYPMAPFVRQMLTQMKQRQEQQNSDSSKKPQAPEDSR